MGLRGTLVAATPLAEVGFDSQRYQKSNCRVDMTTVRLAFAEVSIKLAMWSNSPFFRA